MSARPGDVIVQALQTLHGKDPDYDDGVDARAILAALRTAGLVIEQGWQPIETAPRDGREVLLWVHGIYVIGWYHRGEWRHGPKGYAVSPTHWRPLPTPPECQP